MFITVLSGIAGLAVGVVISVLGLHLIYREGNKRVMRDKPEEAAKAYHLSQHQHELSFCYGMAVPITALFCLYMGEWSFVTALCGWLLGAFACFIIIGIVKLVYLLCMSIEYLCKLAKRTWCVLAELLGIAFAKFLHCGYRFARFVFSEKNEK